MSKNITSTPNYSAVRNVETVRKGKSYSLYDPSLHTDYPRRRPGSSCIGATLLKGKKKIKVWDPHFTASQDHGFCKYVDTDSVEKEILSYYHGTKEDCKYDGEILYDDICNLLKYKKLNYTVKIYLYHYEFVGDLHKQGIFLSHDRFLIADDDYYIMGTSMTSQLNGNLLYGVHEVQEEEDKDIIYESYYKYRDFSEDEDFRLIISY